MVNPGQVTGYRMTECLPLTLPTPKIVNHPALSMVVITKTSSTILVPLVVVVVVVVVVAAPATAMAVTVAVAVIVVDMVEE